MIFQSPEAFFPIKGYQCNEKLKRRYVDLPSLTLQIIHCENSWKSAQKAEHKTGKQGTVEPQTSSGWDVAQRAAN